jgi:ribose transport system substrate-binding protein
VKDVIVGFAQQQLQAPYFAAMQVQAQEIATKEGFQVLIQAAN